MKGSIIIPTCQRADLLAETLDSLAVQTEQDFEVIVVCDGTDRDTEKLAQIYAASFPLHWIFNTENKGQAAARNDAAQVALGEILLFLDDDTAAAPDWVLQHYRHHQSNSENKKLVVSGKIVETFSQRPMTHTERLLRKSREISLKAFEKNPTDDFFACCGLNCSINRATFLQASGFDPILRDIDEDMEFGYRLFSRGIRFISEPKATVYHRNSKNLKRYYTSCYSAAGRAHIYRVLNKNQRCSQTRPLARLHQGKNLRSLKEQLIWDFPQAARIFSESFYRLTEFTGLEFFFRLWRTSIASTEYWEAVKSQGSTLNSLQEQIGSPLPILAFHSISTPTEKREKKYCLSPPRFVRYLQLLRQLNYQSLGATEALSGPLPPRRILLTFDDGYEDFYTEVFPLIQQFAIKPMVFIVVGKIGKTNTWDEPFGYKSRRLLSLDQIREMHRYGVLFGAHTLTHPWLPDLSEQEIQKEVAGSKKRLEDLLGDAVDCFAYPGGGVDQRAQAAVAQAGYKIGFTTNPGLNFWENPLQLKRMEIGETDSRLDFVLKLSLGRDLKNEISEQCHQLLRMGLDLLPHSLSEFILRTRRLRNFGG